jgi:hypothetical protein
VRAVEADPVAASAAAREVARTCFDSQVVLAQLLSDAGVD